MRIAITGSRGQLGRELSQVLSIAHHVFSLARPEFDVTNASIIQSIIHLEPDIVVHAAAMTDVDGCARDPMAAYRSNALGTHNVTIACQQSNAVMVYISTNEVFDGLKGSPYFEWEKTHPINPYGESKLAGERYVKMLLDHFYIVRTAWMYSRGDDNFPQKMIELAKQGGHLAVVDDEIGNPTYAPDLARALAALIETRHYGIYHLVGEGVASRYDWAARILQFTNLKTPITRAKLADFQRASTPPAYGALANFVAFTSLGIKLRPWQEALEEYFVSIKQ